MHSTHLRPYGMPTRPKKIKRAWKSERVAFGRRKDNSEFYNSPRWRKVSKLNKNKNPECVKCRDKGIVTAVRFTDHIVRIEDGGAPYSDDNLQSLCEFHHNSKSGKEAHGYKEGYGVKSPKPE